MKKKHWMMIAATGVGLALGVGVACSSSDTASSGSTGTGGTTGAGASSTTTTTTAGAGGLSGSGGSTTTTSGTGGTTTTTTGTGGTAGGGGQACSQPSTLHPPSADAGVDTLYCPFSGVDGGKNVYCDPSTQHCCETPKSANMPSTCDALSMPCGPGDTDWKCEDPVADCPSGQQCCGTGTVVVSTDPMCGNYATGFKGTKCEAMCAAGEIIMCTSDSECPTGKTCTPFRTKGNQVGACL